MLSPTSKSFIALLGALGALTPLSVDAVLPALPGLAAVFDAAPDRVQLTISVFVLAFAVGQLVYGPLSDRFGRRPVLLGGLCLYIAGGIGCAFAETLPTLVAMRAVQGLGACVGRALVAAIVRDRFARQEGAEILSWVGMTTAIAPVVAPIIGSYLLVAVAWEAIFLFFAGYGVLLLAVIATSLPESLQARDPGAIRPAVLLRSWMSVLGHRVTSGCALVNAFVFAGMFCFISNASFVLIDAFGVSVEMFALLFALEAVSFMAGTALNGRLTRLHGPQKMLPAALLLFAVAGMVFLAAGLFGGVAALIGAAMLLTFIGGLVLPNATAIAMEPMPHIAGVASSLLGAVQMAAGSLAAYAIGVLYDGTAVPMAAGVGFCALAAGAVFLLLVRK